MAALNKLQMGVWGGLRKKIRSKFYIGNIADIYPTIESFTSRFHLSNTYTFSNYIIRGNDVEVDVNRDKFSLNYSAFSLAPNITYYIDVENATKNIQDPFRNTQVEFIRMLGITSLGNAETFRHIPNCRRYYFPNCNSITGRTALWAQVSGELFYVPKATSLAYDNSYNIGPIRPKSGAKIYVHPSLETINDGGMHKALVYAQNQGGIIIFVQNDIAPVSITDLSVSNITSNSVQIDFTTPLGSANAIDYYEVWLEEVDVFNPVHRYLPRYKKITTSGQTLNGLISGKTYKLKLATCDIYLNGSGVLENAAFSNEVTFTTL